MQTQAQGMTFQMLVPLIQTILISLRVVEHEHQYDSQELG
jgi:hypothetical protein